MSETVVPSCYMKKGVLKNLAKFTGKHLCQNLFFNKVAGLNRKFPNEHNCRVYEDECLKASRGVFRMLSRIYDRAFFESSLLLKTANWFRKKVSL